MLLLCRTCPRYDRFETGNFGRHLGSALAERGIEVRNVVCLGGCREHGAVAMDGPGKARVRFTGLGEDEAATIAEAASAYDASDSGVPSEWEVPPGLVDRISAVTPKRPPGGAA
jgi:predicted metal-binding protein